MNRTTFFKSLIGIIIAPVIGVKVISKILQGTTIGIIPAIRKYAWHNEGMSTPLNKMTKTISKISPGDPTYKWFKEKTKEIFK